MKHDAPPAKPADASSFAIKSFPALFGAFLGLTLLKFGNPPIMEKWVTPPADVYQFFLWSPWPISWAYVLLAAVLLLGLASFRWKTPAPPWPLIFLLLWTTWQFVSAFYTVDPELTAPTVAHLVASVLCFFLGCFCLARSKNLSSFLLPLIIAYLIVLAVGIHQHFGGLAETRRHFFLYIYPTMTEFPPGLLKKVSSERIFATLFYPNTLAGALLLFFPLVLTSLAEARKQFTFGARAFLLGMVGLAAVCCMVWSGSKGGWLVLLGLGLIALLRLPFSYRLKVAIVLSVLVLGMGGFAIRYHAFFSRGATSVVARFDYWSAALRTASQRPLTGTGPGTFQRPYQLLKKPESEMARLTHNDYLEQASDSGWPAFVAYTGFIVCALLAAYPPAHSKQRSKTPEPSPSPSASAAPPSSLHFALWLGSLGWAIQSLFEFSLYIPALAWPAFTFLGLLLGLERSPSATPVASNRVDKGRGGV